MSFVNAAHSQPTLRDPLTQLSYDNLAASGPVPASDSAGTSVTSQVWFVALVSFTALLLLSLVLIMSYCVYRKHSPKQRRSTSFVDAAGAAVSYGSTAVDTQMADTNNNSSRLADQAGADRATNASRLTKRPSLIAYPDMHIEVTIPLQIQPTAEQLAQDATLLDETPFDTDADATTTKQASDTTSALGSKRKSSSHVDETGFEPDPLPVERYLAASASSVSCSSTPSVAHRACSPTQSLPASTTGSASSGVAHSSVSTARRSRLKGLLESRRGSSASLTISLTPSSSIALGSLGCADELAPPAAPLPPGCVDSRAYASALPSAGGSERTLLEHMVAAKSRPPLALGALGARVQQNVPAIHEEFWSIPMNHFHKVTVPGASIKNRYRTILPNEHSRVTLHPPFHRRTASQNGGPKSPSDAHANGDSPACVDPLSVYINANYVRAYVPSVDRANPVAQALASRAFIATQGPLPNTVNDFWRMCWFERTPCVVMITRLYEKSKCKCESYLPPFNGSPSVNASAASPSAASSPCGAPPQPPTAAASVPPNAGASPASIVTQSFGDIQVSVLSLQIKDGYEVRDVLLQCDNETHAVKHYWFTAWPDNKTPNTAKQLIHVILEIRAHRDKQAAILQRIRQRHSSPSCSLRMSTSEAYPAASGALTTGQPQAQTLQTVGAEQQPIVLGPTVVHCSAGLGRTGCFIAIYNAIQQYEAEQAVDILGVVAQMRLDRGGLIQTNEQYEFVYRAICEYASNYCSKNLAATQA